MSIPRTWSEELITEWLGIIGYSVEVGIPVGTGARGGRKEADVIGVRIDGSTSGKRVLEICHVEVGELGGNHSANVSTLKTRKFEPSRVAEVCSRFKARMAFKGDIRYEKLYVDIWASESKVNKLMADPDIAREEIKVYTLKTLFTEVLNSMKVWKPIHTAKSSQATLPEGYWMLKLIESLREWHMLP
jgi:hypothetical protein